MLVAPHLTAGLLGLRRQQALDQRHHPAQLGAGVEPVLGRWRGLQAGFHLLKHVQHGPRLKQGRGAAVVALELLAGDAPELAGLLAGGGLALVGAQHLRQALVHEGQGLGAGGKGRVKHRNRGRTNPTYARTVANGFTIK